MVRSLSRDRLRFFETLWRTYGDFVKIPLGHKTLYLVNDAEAIERILRGNHKNYRKAQMFNEERRAALGEGLLTSYGDFWRRQRKLSQPAFQPNALGGYVQRIAEIGAEAIPTWGSPEPVELAGHLTRTTIRISSEILLGVDLKEQADGIREAVHGCVEVASARIAALTKMPLWWPSAAHRRFRRGLDYLDRLIYSLIEERGPDATGNDVFSRLLRARDDESGEAMTRQALRDEVITFLVAGYESTAAALAWTAYLLGRHPDVQARLVDEVARVLGDRLPTAADLPKLEYTGWVIQESMRLYPPSWLFDREAIAADQLGDRELPAGATVLIVPYTLHRHPDHWPDAETFDPLRFSPENAAGRHGFAYVPFSAGPRQCIGNRFAMVESVILIAMLARRYRLSVVEAHPIEPLAVIALRPKHGVMLRLEERT
jgi:cytochrome P450